MSAPYLLDTDHCVANVKASHPGHVAVASRITSMSAKDLRVSIFSVMELSEGPWHSEKPEGYHDTRCAIHTFLAWIRILSPTCITMEEFGRIRALLRKQGQLIKDLDLAIAATALSYDLTLVTHNTQHFKRVPGLRLEDWYS